MDFLTTRTPILERGWVFGDLRVSAKECTVGVTLPLRSASSVPGEAARKASSCW